jgi:hypothetical protein
MARHAGGFIAVPLLDFMSVPGRAQESQAKVGLKAQTISGAFATLLAVSAPIVIPALVSVPLGCEEPDDKF